MLRTDVFYIQKKIVKYGRVLNIVIRYVILIKENKKNNNNNSLIYY